MQTLTYEQSYAITEALFPLAEREVEFARRIKADGFEAFDPMRQWLLSFCPTETDRQIHMRLRIDEIKRRLSAPSVELPSVEFKATGRMKEFYKGALVKELEHKRDTENGVPGTELRKHYGDTDGWIREAICPCERSRRAFNVENEAEYQILDQQKDLKKYNLFSHEANLHASDISSDWVPNRKDRVRLFYTAAQKYLAPLGFSRVPAKSSARIPAVCKKISDKWELRWLLTHISTFGYTTCATNPLARPKFEAALIICPTDLPASLRVANTRGPVLEIRYTELVFGFYHAYWIFFTGPEIETIVKARATLLGYVLEDIERESLKALNS